MTLRSEDMRRAIVAFGTHDLTPMSPRAFYDQLFPTMARVYVEVSDENKELGMVNMDKRVCDALVKVLGFDPANDRYQYAVELNVQVWALNRSREAERALYLADEVEQLDGQAALDYAAGWMRALEFFNGLVTCPESSNNAEGVCQRQYCPSQTTIDEAMKRELILFKPAISEHFESGYRKCIECKTDTKHCVLAYRPGVGA